MDGAALHILELFASTFFLGHVVVLVLMLLLCPFSLWNERLKKLNTYIVLHLVSFIFVSMWITLGLFTWFRQHFHKKGGVPNQDFALSFGQVLALAIWMPVVVEFGYLYFQGSESALTGQLAKPFRAVKVESAEQRAQNYDGDQELLTRTRHSLDVEHQHNGQHDNEEVHVAQSSISGEQEQNSNDARRKEPAPRTSTSRDQEGNTHGEDMETLSPQRRIVQEQGN